MGLTLEDGKGMGNIAEVDNNNRLQVFAVTQTEGTNAAEDGDSYSWANATYDYAAADTILLVRNDSSTYDLHIDKIYISGDTATAVTVHCPTAAFTIAGTAVTGTNMNRKSGRVAPATAKANETGNTQGAIIFRGVIVANAAPYVLELDGSIVLGTGHSIGVDYVSDGGAARVVIFGHFSKLN